MRLYKQWHRPISKRLIVSLLHNESNLDRLGLLSPTHDQRSQQQTGQITLQPVLINKPKFLKATLMEGLGVGWVSHGRERWCCAGLRFSKFDIDTSCQTSIKYKRPMYYSNIAEDPILSTTDMQYEITTQ